MSMTVWVDSWQMQCCGGPFRRGSQVAWALGDADPDWLEAVLGAVGARAVDAAEEHHGGVPEDTTPTLGTVTRITAVHCRYEPLPGSGSPASYPVSALVCLPTSSQPTGGPLTAAMSNSSATSSNSNADSGKRDRRGYRLIES